MSAWIVFRKEIKSFFRDKNTIIHSIILPIALYPLIFWVMNQVITLQQGALSEMPARIAFTAKPADELVFELFESDEDFTILSTIIPSEELTAIEKEDFHNLEVDVVVHQAGAGIERHYELFYDSASDRSNEARERLESIIGQYNLKLLGQTAGISNGQVPEMEVIKIDFSTSEGRSRFILGIVLPMIIVIITVMGGMYPAIEVITSERERKTIETTLASPINETSLVLGKFGAVIAMSSLAGLLNIVAMLLTLQHTLFSGMLTDFDFSLPLSSIPLVFLGMLLIAATFGALMVMIAAFAKDFKEAQSYVSPVYAIGIQPAVVAAMPGVPFNSLTALIPVTNISLFFRSLIQGTTTLVPSLITIGSLMLWCGLLLYLARQLLRRDAIVLGLSKDQLKSLLNLKSLVKGARS